MKLNEDMKNMIAEELAYIATVDENGNPNIGPKRSMRVLDDEHLIFCENTGGQHLANINANGKISIAFVKRAENKGYRINGTAKSFTDEEHMNVAKEKAGTMPKKAAVIVDVKKVFTLASGPLAGKLVEE